MARILIVENSIFMKGSLKFLLEQAGHSVIGVATDQAEALHFYGLFNPDIVTCDLLMRGQDGMPVIKALLEKHPEARLVAVFVSGLETKIAEAKQAGAVGILEKPYRFDELIKEISLVSNLK